MRAATFFREIRFPSAHNERQEYERFLLDTWAERREETPATESAATQLARRLRKLVSGDLR